MSKSTKVRDFIQKHFRQIVGVLLLGIVVFLLFYRLGTMPAGLNEAEIESATISGQANFLRDIIDLPWHAWQGLFVRLIGLNVWSVRLPAAILAVISVIVLWRILNWMTDETSAMLGAVVSATSVLFIGMGRTGMANIMTVLLIELVVLFGLRSFNGRRGLVLAAVCWGILIFMKGGLVCGAVLLAVALLHPRIRLWLVTDKTHLVKAGAIGGLSVLLFGGLAVARLNVGRSFSLGSFSRPSIDNLAASLSGIFASGGSLNGGLITPYLSIIGLALMILGLVSVLRDCIFSMRAYLIIGLLALTIGLSLFDEAAGCLVFLPAAMLVAIALSELITGWYGIFPHNPYARGFAVAPLVLLICSLCTTNASRYFLAINYDPDIVYHYNASVPAVLDIAKGSDNDYTLVASGESATVYQLIKLDNVKISDKLPKRGKVIILGSGKAPSAYRLERVVTSGLSRDYVVARVYSR